MNLKEILGRERVLNTNLAEAKLRFYKDKIGDMSYDEVLKLAVEAEDIYKYLPPGDPAQEFMYRQMYNMYQYANYLNVIEKLNRKDHQVEITALVSYGPEVAEHNFLVNKHDMIVSYNKKSKVVEAEVVSALRSADVWIKYPIEVVVY
jgi:hypothetical protein